MSFLKILQHYTYSFNDKDIFLYKLHSIYRMDIGSAAHHNLRISTFISNFAVTIDKYLYADIYCYIADEQFLKFNMLWTSYILSLIT